MRLDESEGASGEVPSIDRMAPQGPLALLKGGLYTPVTLSKGLAAVAVLLALVVSVLVGSSLTSYMLDVHVDKAGD
jgi:hypothetical protein